MKLLTAEISSPKLVKSAGSDYLTAILYLSGAGDTRLCPSSTAGCRVSCLITESGRGVFASIRKARQARTDMLFDSPDKFEALLIADIKALIRKASRLGKIPAVRLNGGSDLNWSHIYTQFPSVQFWEYTKRPDMAVTLSQIPNVHMSYSHNENTTNRILSVMLQNDINIVMVFNIWSRKGGELPSHVGNVPVVDGDITDLRFLDPKGYIVGLRFKSAKKPDIKMQLQFVQKAG